MVVEENSIRKEEYKRNPLLEELLKEINDTLWIAERTLLTKEEPEYPLIFIVGAPRSGTTLFMQWIANTGIVAYPTNLMSRFYKSPIIGAKLQLLLADKRYSYREEIVEFFHPIDFKSKNGKTKGALSPNEFWYFWRRFLPFKDIDYIPSEELFKLVDIKTLKSELAGVCETFKKPFAMKAMILNYNLDFINAIFKKLVFVYIKRNPLANIESLLEARKRYYGSIEHWYSFKIPEYPYLIKRNPYEQVAGQIYFTNRAISEALKNIEEHRKLFVNYEDFCTDPKSVFDMLVKKLEENGYPVQDKYRGPKRFKITREKVKDRKILEAYKVFYNA